MPGDGRGLRGARLCAPQEGYPRARARHRPPGRLAAERARLLRRRGEADRLRHRQGGKPAAEHAGGNPQRQVQLHVSRAGAGASGRRPQRHLRRRHPPLGVGLRREALHWRKRLRRAGESAQRPRPLAPPGEPRGAGGARARHPQGPRKSATRPPASCTTS